MNTPIAPNHPTLILIRGLPGSGKTYLATALQESLGHDKVVVLDPDASDYSSQEYRHHSQALTAEGVDKKFHPYRFIRAKAYQAIRDHTSILWTQAFTSLEGLNKTVINLQTYAAEHDTTLPVLIVEVDVREKTARERAKKREQQTGRDVSEEAFTRFLNDYVSFAHQGYPTVTVQGEGDVATSIAAVHTALAELWKK